MNFHQKPKSLVKLAYWLWPTIRLAEYQRDIMQSVEENDETVVVAGNMLGKDCISAIIAITFFLSRNPCRIVTTSADAPQLEAVLWGEIRRWIGESRYNLDSKKGGPLLINHLHIRKVLNPADGTLCPLSYIIGRVSAKGEGLLGHHIAETGNGIPKTLLIVDEASGVEDEAFERSDTWAKRKLVIGNPYPCANFFFKAVKGGNVPHKPYTSTPV